MAIRQRVLSIDILKAISVVVLIIVHQVVWSLLVDNQGGLRHDGSRSVLCLFFRSGVHLLGLLPALAGASFILRLDRKTPSFREVLRRAAFLAGVGIVINFIALDWDDLLDWDILQFVALCQVFTYFLLRKIPEKTGFIIIGILGIVCILMADQLPFHPRGFNYLYSIIVGDMEGEHYWPFIPCYALFGIGVLAGKCFLVKNRERVIRTAFALGLVGVLISVGKGVFLSPCDISNLWGPALFKPHPIFMLGIICSSLALIVGVELLLSIFPFLKSCFNNKLIRFYSQGILWIYFVFYILIYPLTGWIVTSFTFNFGWVLVLIWGLVIAELLLAYFVGGLVSREKKAKYEAIQD